MYSGLKTTGIFVILLSQDGLKVTVQKHSSKESLPKASLEAFFKINFLKNFTAAKYLCWSISLIKLQA